MSDLKRASLQDCEATWSDEVEHMALLYVYRPGRRKNAQSVRQVVVEARVIFDLDAAGELLGAEVITEVPRG